MKPVSDNMITVLWVLLPTFLMFQHCMDCLFLSRFSASCVRAVALRCRFLQNSNLVLTAETRTREAAEPSGEPESLHGRMRGKMGDRVLHSKPEGYEERKQKAAKKRQAQQEFELEAPKQKRRVSG